MRKKMFHFYLNISDKSGIKTRRILIDTYSIQCGGKTLMSETRVMAALLPSESCAW